MAKLKGFDSVLKGLDSIVVTDKLGEVLCVIGMDGRHICSDKCVVVFCEQEPEFADVDGIMYLKEKD